MSKFHFVHPEELAKPARGLAVNYVDDWWMVDAEGRIAFFASRGSSKYSSPQCNSNEEIVRRLVADQVAKREAGGEGIFNWAVEARHIPLVSVPASPSDYS